MKHHLKICILYINNPYRYGLNSLLKWKLYIGIIQNDWWHLKYHSCYINLSQTYLAIVKYIFTAIKPSKRGSYMQNVIESTEALWWRYSLYQQIKIRLYRCKITSQKNANVTAMVTLQLKKNNRWIKKTKKCSNQNLFYFKNSEKNTIFLLYFTFQKH